MPDEAPAAQFATVDTQMSAVLDQVLLGLLPPDALPNAATYLDEEGTPVAVREGGSITGLRGALPWQSPADVRARGALTVVVAPAEQLPAVELPVESLVLLPVGAVRADDARQPEWLAAWTQAAVRANADVVLVPVPAAEAERRAPELAASYSIGKLTLVPTTPQRRGTGRTVFFTGFSGSGKSTIARALVERLAGTRTITLLDGDVVRTHLSKGLGFSAEDRDTNIRRIGWVAAEVTKHGGLAVCAPIAPYDATRRWVRDTVDAAGGAGSLLLVWVSTPLEVCESRDVKGLYAKARRGEVKGFTGIDDPYEQPDDADLVIDTSVVPLESAVDQVIELLH